MGFRPWNPAITSLTKGEWDALHSQSQSQSDEPLDYPDDALDNQLFQEKP